uniref:Uncharacterized protein n=1 Tax=Glossina austeni TaxID=7395 RepID=A0A1A9UTB5_GLOAU
MGRNNLSKGSSEVVICPNKTIVVKAAISACALSFSLIATDYAPNCEQSDKKVPNTLRRQLFSYMSNHTPPPVEQQVLNRSTFGQITSTSGVACQSILRAISIVKWKLSVTCSTLLLSCLLCCFCSALKFKEYNLVKNSTLSWMSLLCYMLAMTMIAICQVVVSNPFHHYGVDVINPITVRTVSSPPR